MQLTNIFDELINWNIFKVYYIAKNLFNQLMLLDKNISSVLNLFFIKSIHYKVFPKILNSSSHILSLDVTRLLTCISNPSLLSSEEPDSK